jgi:hypothetical protein
MKTIYLIYHNRLCQIKIQRRVRISKCRCVRTLYDWVSKLCDCKTKHKCYIINHHPTKRKCVLFFLTRKIVGLEDFTVERIREQ